MNTKTAFIPVHQHFAGKFNTHTGRTIDLAGPDPAEIDINDIATALSRICRFGGHSSAFYSVAQHSVLVCFLCSQEAAKAGLLHDAAEAYLGDVIKPLKVMLGEAYTSIEDRFGLAILNKYGIDAAEWHRLYTRVKVADKFALELEHEALILNRPGRLVAVLEDFNLTTFGWAWDSETAKELFLAMFHKLFN